jgi:competence protein ComEC
MKQYPFIGHSLIFISGITASHFVSITSNYFLIPLLLSVAIFMIRFAVKEKTGIFKISFISSYVFFFMLGGFLFALRIEGKSFLPEEYKSIERMIVIGDVEQIDLRKVNAITFVIKTDSVRIEKKYHPYKVGLYCRVRGEPENINKLYDKLIPGNKVRIEGTFQEGREERNPGEFNYDKHLSAKGISGLFYVSDPYEVKIINWNSNVFQHAIFSARKYLDAQISDLHNSQSAGLLRGLLLADRSNIDHETKTEFVNSGVMHILAVSGLHVGYIILIFVFVFGRFNVFVKSLLTILGLVLFMFVTGMPASVFRAVTMAVVILMAFMMNRSTNIYNSLAIAAFIILSLNPEELFGPGFQLSFLAVLSIAVIYPIFQKYVYSLRIKSNVINYLLLFIGVSLSAQIGTLPLTFIYFGKLSLVSLLTNLFVIPMAGMIVGIAVLTLALNAILPSIALLYASVNEAIIFLLFKLVSIAGSNEYSFLPIKDFSTLDAVIFYAAIIIIILISYKAKSAKAKLVTSLLVILNAVLVASLDNKKLLEDDKLFVMMIDVSQGDATLIQFPNGQTALIDGGYASFYFDNGERIISPLITKLGIQKIDYAFVTSMTQESYGGFVSMIRKGLVNNLVKPLTDSTMLVDMEFEKLLKQNGVNAIHFKDDKFVFGNVNVYSLTVNESINPKRKLNSGMLKIIFGNTSFLFPGNIENEAEYLFTEKYKSFLKSDVLKIANNGNIKSTSVEFLSAVQPNVCLLSIPNQNKFVKPSQVILERINKAVPKYFRTDEEGTVLLQSDGSQISKINWK